MSLFTLDRIHGHSYNAASQETLVRDEGRMNQDGFVLITAMMILVAVTLLGVAALNTATFETMIAGNEKQFQQQFFYSDAGINAMLGESNKPNDGQRPGAGVNLNTIGCNNLQGHTAFAYYDVDGDPATATTDIFYLQRLLRDPLEVEVLSCADNGKSVVGIIAGVGFSSGPEDPGNPTSY